MKTSFTTMFGVLGAVSLALTQLTELTSAEHKAAVIGSAICVALLGYCSNDKTPCPPIPPALLIAGALGGLVLACSGCRLGGFALHVKSQQFGSVGLAFDSGTIGNVAVSGTNAQHKLIPP